MGNAKGNTILVGFKGCGKTTVGKIIASRLKKVFIDTDTLIEDIHKNRTGEDIPFRQIFKDKGKDYFLSLEREVIEEITKVDDRVISLGGGTLSNTPHVSDIQKLGKIIFIYVEKEKLYNRIMTNGLPSIFDKDDPKKSFDSIYQKRIDIYRDVSNLTIDNSYKTPEEAAEEIIKQLKGHNVR